MWFWSELDKHLLHIMPMGESSSSLLHYIEYALWITDSPLTVEEAKEKACSTLWAHSSLKSSRGHNRTKACAQHRPRACKFGDPRNNPHKSPHNPMDSHTHDLSISTGIFWLTGLSGLEQFPDASSSTGSAKSHGSSVSVDSTKLPSFT